MFAAARVRDLQDCVHLSSTFPGTSPRTEPGPGDTAMPVRVCSEDISYQATIQCDGRAIKPALNSRQTL